MAANGDHLIHFTDAGGCEVTFFNFNGKPFPLMPGDMVTRMATIEQLKARDDDVCICGYVKSGTNWMWEVVSILMAGKTEHMKTGKNYMCLEYRDRSELDCRPSPRILNTHLLFGELPPDIRNRKCKIVYLLRNPKDICVSHFHHQRDLLALYKYNGNFSDYLELWLKGQVDYGSWFEYVKQWEKDLENNAGHPIHIMYYEDIKRNFVDEATKLGKFLGLSHSRKFYEKVAELCDFEEMKKVKDGRFTAHERAIWRDNKPMFFRKGIIGDWKSHFTVAQNEKFDSVFKEKMKGSKLQFFYGS